MITAKITKASAAVILIQLFDPFFAEIDLEISGLGM
jgi:hypothetical protein